MPVARSGKQSRLGLLQLPAAHLAYTYHHFPGQQNYEPDPYWTSNPAGGKVEIDQFSIGEYHVTWSSMDPLIINDGNLHVTAVGLYDSAYCKLTNVYLNGAAVRCYAANGSYVDTGFTVMIGS